MTGNYSISFLKKFLCFISKSIAKTLMQMTSTSVNVLKGLLQNNYLTTLYSDQKRVYKFLNKKNEA